MIRIGGGYPQSISKLSLRGVLRVLASVLGVPRLHLRPGASASFTSLGGLVFPQTLERSLAHHAAVGPAGEFDLGDQLRASAQRTLRFLAGRVRPAERAVLRIRGAFSFARSSLLDHPAPKPVPTRPAKVSLPSR